MNPAAGASHDLVVLVADKDMEAAFQGLLGRARSLGTRLVQFRIFVHGESDPGCFLRGPAILRSLTDDYSYALIAFDREGCGREGLDRAELEADLERRVAETGWTDATTSLRDWLRDKGHWTPECGKPSPAFLRLKRILSAWFPESSSL